MQAALQCVISLSFHPDCAPTSHRVCALLVHPRMFDYSNLSNSDLDLPWNYNYTETSELPGTPVTLMF